MNRMFTLDRTAAEWLVRVQAARDGATAGALDAWLAASIDHRIAYAEVLAAWHGVTAAAPPRPAAPVFAPARVFRYALPALAASLVALGLALAWRPAPDHRAPTGSVARAVLEDGSTLSLASGSSADVELDAAVRRIALHRGELFVDVAKDPGRPLQVAIGDVTVVAIGTRFAVAAWPGAGLAVAVEEGVVEVTRGGGAPIRLGASEMLEVDSADGPVALPRNALAWTHGTLVFDGEPLGEALAILERWTPGRIVCLSACDQAVHGAFPIARAEDAVDALAAQRGLSVRRVPRLAIVGR